ncbi:MAG TPA: D-2-hydroxyacid dehydrogenase family protein [Streptosporangiaceae bacterium]|nr:D-2-hydroxyacid dehydrogenase family protein [Streptosporangiaceae bacterium]
MRVAILDDYQRAALTSASWPAGAELTVFTSHISRTEALVRELAPFEAIVAMRERTPFTSERLAQLPQLKLLVTTGMSNASIDMDAARARGVTVCGTGAAKGATTELTWALILAAARHITAEDAYLKAAGRAGGAALSRGWQHTLGTGLHGKNLGVVGLGTQGKAVAKVGRAFGMKLLAWSANLSAERAEKAHATLVSKQELFASADVVTIHYRLSPRSAGLVGADELALMKPDSILVNTSRGQLVDSAALIAALRSGSIAGAGLDVFDEEPLPLSHPLRTLPNVVLTPHLGYVTRETYEVYYREAAEDIAAFAAGAPVRVLNLPSWRPAYPSDPRPARASAFSKSLAASGACFAGPKP